MVVMSLHLMILLKLLSNLCLDILNWFIIECTYMQGDKIGDFDDKSTR